MSPGFALREAHAHIYQAGRALNMVDLAACESVEEVLEALGACEARSGAVLAHGARPESWVEQRWPSADEIESVARGRVLVAWCFDYHALIASRAALRAAGIDERTPDPPGGIIERDDQGRLTGVVCESAALRVWESLPEPDAAERKRCVQAGVRALVENHGFVEIHDLKAQRWLGGVLRSVVNELDGAVHVRIWPLLEDLDEVLETRRTWESEHVRLGGAKIFVDGTLNSRTAWMLYDYADGREDHPRGIAMMTPREIEEAVRRCDAAGVPLAAHAIGDAAVRAVLDAIERVGPSGSGFRIEHCELVDETDVPRLAELGVIASVQPCHLLYDMEALARGVPDRLDRVLPLRELIESGLKPGEGLIFGSDVPIVRADPEDSVLAAVERRRGDGPGPPPIAPSQAISREQAWECFRSTVGV